MHANFAALARTTLHAAVLGTAALALVGPAPAKAQAQRQNPAPRQPPAQNPTPAQPQDSQIPVQVYPIAIDLEDKTGRRVPRSGLKAIRPAPPDSSEQAMITNAQGMFDRELRRRTEEAKGDLAAVIYDLGPTMERGVQATRIYAVLFVREDGAWRRVGPKPPEKPQDAKPQSTRPQNTKPQNARP